MLNKRIEKTKSEHKALLRMVLILLCVAVVSVLFFFVVQKKHVLAPADNCKQAYRVDLRDVLVGGEKFSVEVASSASAHENGLSGRACIEQNTAMLFKFAQPGNYGFWMKDMLFDIDIVWLDKNKTITHVESHVKASSYLKVYYPGIDSSYVFELHGGRAIDLGLANGQQLIW